MMSEKRYTNRLINEKSPYLLQHAHNPVDWYPWGEEAFEAAKENDKPIFLSIGYATCHWCRIMEKECFENESIADLMNDAFINIKVDREELPEIDGLYMELAQLLIPDGGGWPLNVLLTTDLKPFFATTYIPPQSSKGQIGLADLVKKLKEIWLDSEERENLIEQSSHLLEAFEAQAHYVGKEIPSYQPIREAASLIFQLADPVYGGIKGEPKFPLGYHCCFLLRHTQLSSESRALFYVELTLDMMQRGGIYDHLGGGFSRYSIDNRWVIPHFEKMLYDNAILSRTYLEAWLFTKNPFYKEVCQDILRYVLREMNSPQGGFYSAEDADLSGKEGRYYTWTVQEIKEVLGEDAQFFSDFYLHPEGTFDHRFVLYVKDRFEDFPHKKGLDAKDFHEKLEGARSKLLKAREQRQFPDKDDKILVAWNGLMIDALVRAYRVFDQPSYLEAVLNTVKFIRTHLWKDGHLLRRWRAGEAKYPAGLDEYAFMIQGLLTLFEDSGEAGWLAWAIEMADILEEEFKIQDGAFYLSSGEDLHLVLRRCEFYDGAEPSGNGVHCENLLRLHQLTGEESYLRQAEDVLKAVSKSIEEHLIGCCYHLMALQRYYDKHASTLVVVLNSKKEYINEIRHLVFDHFLPHHSLIWKTKDNEKELAQLSPFTKSLEAISDKTTLYVYQKGQCQKTLSEWPDIVTALT